MSILAVITHPPLTMVTLDLEIFAGQTHLRGLMSFQRGHGVHAFFVFLGALKYSITIKNCCLRDQQDGSLSRSACCQT